MQTNYELSDIFAVAKNQAEINTLSNNDVYKFYMLDFILNHKEYRNLEVEREMTIRSHNIRTADIIPQEELIEQLKATQDIRGLEESDIQYIKKIKHPSGTPIFSQKTLNFLKDFSLPDFKIKNDGNGNYQMKFVGPWEYSMMWEIFGLKILNTLYLYNYIKKEKLSKKEFNTIISKSLGRLFKDIEIFQSEPDTKFSEFGTRRSLSTYYQRIINEILENNLPGQYLGTSNVMIAKERGHNKVVGTNAHELRMVPTALYDTPGEIINEMYEIDRKWAKHFPEMALLLPDTYGTSFYLQNAPGDIIKNHIGNRLDSKNPYIAIPEYIDWLLSHEIDPMTKVAIPSDGLNAQTAVDITRQFKDKIGILGFGIGTNLTNNTKNTWPRKEESYGPFGSFSVVIKPSKVKRKNGTWVSAVKLSDNPEKAVGEVNRVTRFKEIFGTQGLKRQFVEV